jgi:hypothetical protein
MPIQEGRGEENDEDMLDSTPLPDPKRTAAKLIHMPCVYQIRMFICKDLICRGGKILAI